MNTAPNTPLSNTPLMTREDQDQAWFTEEHEGPRSPEIHRSISGHPPGEMFDGSRLYDEHDDEVLYAPQTSTAPSESGSSDFPRLHLELSTVPDLRPDSDTDRELSYAQRAAELQTRLSSSEFQVTKLLSLNAKLAELLETERSESQEREKENHAKSIQFKIIFKQYVTVREQNKSLREIVCSLERQRAINLTLLEDDRQVRQEKEALEKQQEELLQNYKILMHKYQELKKHQVQETSKAGSGTGAQAISAQKIEHPAKDRSFRDRFFGPKK
ncbi:MAG: hypothetical protein ACKOAD_04850 [Gammaproteobacteria bacterium]